MRTPEARSASTRERAPGASRSPSFVPWASEPRAIARFSAAVIRASSRRRRCAAAPVHAAASAAIAVASSPVAAARSAAQRASAALRSAAPGSSSRASAWYVRHATGAPGAAATVPAGTPNASPVRVHCSWIAELGASTSAGEPSRRRISKPSSVLPEPGGATRCVDVRPAARSRSNASSASRW